MGHVYVASMSELNDQFSPYPAKLTYLNCHPLKVVSLYRDTQLQVAENYLYLFNLKIFTNIDVQKHIAFPLTVICSTNKTDSKRQRS